MSLVNDLVIEVDRRNDPQVSSTGSPLDGLRPARTEDQMRPPIDFLVPSLLGLALTCVGIAAYFIHQPDVPTKSSHWSAEPKRVAVSSPIIEATAGESIHAKRGRETNPAPVIEIQTTDPASSRNGATPLRHEVEVNSVDVARVGQQTQIRIQTSTAGIHHVIHSDTTSDLVIHIENGKLSNAVAPLALTDTPILGWQITSDDHGLQIRLSLSEPVRIGSQWLTESRGGTLLIDLTDSARKAPPVAAKPSAEKFVSSAAATAPIDRWLGDPDPRMRTNSKLAISRSPDDETRRAHKAALVAADRLLDAARLARSAGEPAKAADLFARALADHPGHRVIILEQATLLAELGRTEAALRLIRNARREAPRDAAFSILHAKILAGIGDLMSAITILEDVPMSLAQAPEVYALAAAYLQKTGDHASAIERYESLVRQFPDRAKWWLGMGISLEADGRSEQALDVYRIALDVGPLPESSARWITARVATLREES